MEKVTFVVLEGEEEKFIGKGGGDPTWKKDLNKPRERKFSHLGYSPLHCHHPVLLSRGGLTHQAS